MANSLYRILTSITVRRSRSARALDEWKARVSLANVAAVTRFGQRNFRVSADSQPLLLGVEAVFATQWVGLARGDVEPAAIRQIAGDRSKLGVLHLGIGQRHDTPNLRFDTPTFTPKRYALESSHESE